MSADRSLEGHDVSTLVMSLLTQPGVRTTVNIITAASVAYLGKQVVDWFLARRQLKPPPGPPGHPIMQHIPLLAKMLESEGPHIDTALTKIRDQYKLGNIIRLRVIFMDWVCVLDAEAAKEAILTMNLIKSPTYKPLEGIMGEGSLVIEQDTDKWWHQRKTFAPGFTYSYLKAAALPRFVEKTQILVDRLSRVAGTDEIVLMHKLVMVLTLDIICQVVLSMDFGCLSEEQPEFAKRMTQVVTDVVWYEDRPHLGWMKKLPWEWLRLRRNVQAYDDCMLPLIQERITQAAQQQQQLDAANGSANSSVGANGAGKTKLPDILGMAIAEAYKQAAEEGAAGQKSGGRRKHNEPLTAYEALQQIKAFIFAGHDTTASTIACAVYEISRNPEVQAKVLEEVDRVCGSEAPTADKLPQLTYINAVIKETLRMWPPGGTARWAPAGTKLGGYDIGNMLVYVTHIHVHRDEQYWGKDAGQFQPERWLDGDYVAGIHPCAYMPFSKGPRDCIGQQFALMEAKVVLSMLYQSFTFQYAHDKEEAQGYHVTSYPLYHVPVKVFTRKNKYAAAAAASVVN